MTSYILYWLLHFSRNAFKMSCICCTLYFPSLPFVVDYNQLITLIMIFTTKVATMFVCRSSEGDATRKPPWLVGYVFIKSFFAYHMCWRFADVFKVKVCNNQSLYHMDSLSLAEWDTEHRLCSHWHHQRKARWALFQGDEDVEIPCQL